MYLLHTKQTLPISLDQSWDFFSSPHNLKTITPDYMGFDIIEGGGVRMYPGQIIRYKVSPVMGLRLNWVTEITHVVEKKILLMSSDLGRTHFGITSITLSRLKMAQR